MTFETPGGRSTRIALAVFLIVLIEGHSFAKLETWRTEGAPAFGKAKREGVVVSDAGKVRLGQGMKPLGTLDAARVWDLIRTPSGELYAATGDEGKVFRRDAKEDSPWTVAYDSADSQALSLAIGPDGHVFVGTGPSGQIVDITDLKHPSSRPSPGVQYIWDLASDSKGNLFAATGPTSQLWKRSSEGGNWTLIHDSAHHHLLSVAVAADGTIYAGSDGEGVIYKVAPGGKVSVLFDAPQSEIRSLLVAPDGTVYAGTASDSGGGGNRGPSFLPGGGLTATFGGNSDSLNTATVPAFQEPAKKPEDRSRATSTPSGGTAAPRPLTAGDNAVYRIDSDGVAREIFRAKALMFALALVDDRLLVGTGPEGLLYEIQDQGREASSIARLDTGHILALATAPDGEILIGTGDSGSVVRLSTGHLGHGEFVSEVRDTKLISRFGTLTWRAECPAGTGVALQIRTGNVSEPDSTWSEWSAEQTNPEQSRAHVPPGRFAQYRVKLSTSDPVKTPELSAVTIRYQTANLSPEISRLDVPDLSAFDGATRQPKLTFRWDVSDPNDDDLNYTLFLRKEGWPSWVKLTETPLTDKTYAWDASTVPTGHYRVKLVATDRPSNNARDALQRERISEAFIVDSEAPSVTLKTGGGGASAELKDQWTRIAKASYAIDGGEWTPIFADDGLFDSQAETVTIPLPDLKPGTHVLVLRATDAAGNLGSGDILIKVP